MIAIRGPGSRHVLAALLALHVLAPWPRSLANPHGGAVVAGTATMSESDRTLVVQQTSEKAIINWRGFSNTSGEAVRFAQPTARAVILNRVTGREPSAIDGTVEANGRVFLLNPNGVLLSKTAQVNTGGLVVSTLAMKDQDFLAGRYTLEQDPSRELASVVNQGQIEVAPGGSVALIAPLVSNQGIISAPSGRVALAAGTRAVVTLDDLGLLSVGVRSSAPGNVLVPRSAVTGALEDAVNNRHVLDSGAAWKNAQGEIVIGGGEGLAINQGTITASAAGGRPGRVAVAATQAAVLAPGSSIAVNGHDQGSSGGEIRVTSQGNARFEGGSRLEAKGGPGGDGGFIEVSGAGAVTIQGQVETRAPGGRGGTFLIDPRNIVIVDAGGADDAEVADGAVLVNPVEDRPGANLTITEETLEGLAIGGTDIVLEATNAILVANLSDDVLDLTRGAGGSITLRAGRGGVRMAAGDEIRVPGAQTITIEATFGGGGPLTLGALTTGGGDISLRGDSVQLNGDVNAGGGAVLIGSSGAIDQEPGVSIVAAGLELRALGAVTLDGRNDADTLAAVASGTVSFLDADDLVIGTVGGTAGIRTANADVIVLAGSTLTLAEDVNAGTATARLLAGGDIVTVAGAVFASRAELTAVGSIGEPAAPLPLEVDILAARSVSGSVSVREAGDLILDDVAAAGDVNVQAGGSIFDSGAGVRGLRISLLAVEQIGTLADPILTAASALEAIAMNGSVLITEQDDVFVALVQAANEIVIRNRSGDMTVGTVLAPDGVILVAQGGSLLDGNGADVNVVSASGATSALVAAGTVGTAGDGLEVAVAGTLLADAGGLDAEGVSINLEGTVEPDDTFTILDGEVPGLALFNGRLIFPLQDEANPAVALDALADTGETADTGTPFSFVPLGARMFDASTFTMTADLVTDESGEGEDEEELKKKRRGKSGTAPSPTQER